MRVVALEWCARESYPWGRSEIPARYEKRALLPHESSSAPARSTLRNRMDNALKQVRPDVLAVNGWNDFGALETLSCATARKMPVVVMSESSERDEVRNPFKEWIKRCLVRLCSCALVGGSPHADYMVQLGMPRDRVFLGYDAVDNGYFATRAAEVRAQRSEVRNKYGLPERYFLASARFIEKKNLPRLLKAYAQYRTLCQKSEFRSQSSEVSSESDVRSLTSGPWNLVLLGDGPLKSDICRLISELGLQHSVLLPGFKQYPDLPVYYGLASAFIHASTTEQWGLVVNEAMASGLPVLVSNRCGCAADLVQAGRNGLTFDPCDVEALAQLMLRLTETPEQRLAEMGVASRKVIANWGPERFADGLARAVRTALATPSIRPGWIEHLLLRALLLR